MKQPNIRTRRKKIKAVHRYKVIDTNSKLVLAGTRFHFIGAGGIGMSGLAQLMVKHNAIVAGSDQMASDVVDML